jgi:ketosteroid isomerase-like protein
MSADDSLQLAERLMAAITAADIEAVRDIYAPDAVIWHNNDGIEQSVDDNLRVLRWVVSNIRNLRYEDIRRQRTDGGFVQQHVVRGIAPNGRDLDIRACLICSVSKGRITRLEEYLDSAQIAALLES